MIDSLSGDTPTEFSGSFELRYGEKKEKVLSTLSDFVSPDELFERAAEITDEWTRCCGRGIW
jgi:hypothetical protein